MQFELVLEWASGLVGRWAGRNAVSTEIKTRNAERGTRPSALGSAKRDPARGSPSGGNEFDQLIDRLNKLGLPQFEKISGHTNEQTMLSWVPGKVLRIHEGYAAAPDEVLKAIVRFVTPRTRRPVRLAAKRAFLAFPVDEHAPRPTRPARKIRVAPQDRPAYERLVQMHQELNQLHFEGKLETIPIRVSGRMRTRLGELRLDRKTGRPVHIGISRRHIKRDGWTSVTDTLLHEMVHQWQAETGAPVDHGRGFRAKAKLVGIEPRAVRRDW